MRLLSSLTRHIDAPTMKSDVYRAARPFGQLPVLEETGRPPLFESGAIVVDIATRAGRYIAFEGTPESAETLQWAVAALNTVEPVLFNVAEVEYFLEDEAAKTARRPVVVKAAKERLGELQADLDDRAWLGPKHETFPDMLSTLTSQAAPSAISAQHRLRHLNIWLDRSAAHALERRLPASPKCPRGGGD